MKKFVTLLSTVAVVALATSQARAVLLGSETFTYSDGTLTTVAPAGVWSNFSGATALNVSNGVAVLTGVNSQDDGLNLTSTSPSNGVIYASFDVNFTSWPSGSGSYFAFFKDTTTADFRARVLATNTTGGVNIGIGNGVATAIAGSSFLSTTLNFGTTYKVVLRLDQSSGADVSTLWLNPSLETDPGATATDVIGSAPFVIPITQFALRQSNATQGLNWVDNILVGSTFADVVPEPSTIALVGAGMLGLFAIRRRRS